MSAKVTVDAETRAKLEGLREVVEICDESGRPLGRFHPIPEPVDYKELIAQSPFSIEELERRRKQRTGRPLEEILRDLSK